MQFEQRGSAKMMKSEIASSIDESDLELAENHAEAITLFASRTRMDGTFLAMLDDAAECGREWLSQNKRNEARLYDEVMPSLYGAFLHAHAENDAYEAVMRKCKSKGIVVKKRTTVATLVVRAALDVSREMARNFAACCVELALQNVAQDIVGKEIRRLGGIKPIARLYFARTKKKSRPASGPKAPAFDWLPEAIDKLAEYGPEDKRVFLVAERIGRRRFVVRNLARDPADLT